MVIKGINSLLFISYLVLLVLISFPFGSLDGFYWTTFGLAASLLLTLTVLLSLLEPYKSKNLQKTALFKALPFVILLFSQAIYVIFQASFSLGEPKLELISSWQPDWFIQSDKLNIAPNNMVQWLGKMVLVICFFLLNIFLVTSRLRLKIVIYSIIFCALAHGLIGFVANYFKIHLVEVEQIDGHFNVARGLFVNRNHFAAIINYGLAMMMVSGFYYIYSVRSAPSSTRNYIIAIIDFVLSTKLIWLFILAALVVFMNFSTSRAAVLGFFSAISIVSAIASIYDIRLRKVFKFIVIILVFLALLVILSSGEAGVITRLKEGGLSLGDRYEQWALTFSVIKQHWLFGTGAGTYSEAFQYYRENDTLSNVVYDQSHSFYFQLLLEQGIIGFSLWLASIILAIRYFIHGFQSQDSLYIRSVILGVLVALMMALLQSVVDFNLLIPALNVYFYTFIALGYTAISVYSGSSSKKSTHNKNRAIK